MRVIIPPNTFVFADGQGTKGSIQIEIREVFDKASMILVSGFSTTSNGRLLESYGMIELTSTSGEKELQIMDGGAIKISII